MTKTRRDAPQVTITSVVYSPSKGWEIHGQMRCSGDLAAQSDTLPDAVRLFSEHAALMAQEDEATAWRDHLGNIRTGEDT